MGGENYGFATLNKRFRPHSPQPFVHFGRAPVTAKAKYTDPPHQTFSGLTSRLNPNYRFEPY